MAPPFLNLYRIVDASQHIPQRDWVLYSTVMVAYALFGGVFTAAWEPETKLKGIYVGASWPSIVAAMLQSIPGLPK